MAKHGSSDWNSDCPGVHDTEFNQANKQYEQHPLPFGDVKGKGSPNKKKHTLRTDFLESCPQTFQTLTVCEPILPKMFDKIILKNKHVKTGWNLLSIALGAFCFERILQVRHDAFKYEWYYKNNMVAIEDNQVDIVDLIREMHSESQIRDHVLVRSEFSPDQSHKSAASLIKEVIDNYKEMETDANKKNEDESQLDQTVKSDAETHEWKTWEETK